MPNFTLNIAIHSCPLFIRCVSKAGELVLGIILWLTGIVVQLALIVTAVLAMPVILILAVLLLSVSLRDAVELLRVLGLT